MEVFILLIRVLGTGLATPGPVIPNIPATLMIPVTTDEWKAMLNALP